MNEVTESAHSMEKTTSAHVLTDAVSASERWPARREVRGLNRPVARDSQGQFNRERVVD